MSDIFDYMDWRGDLPLSASPFNEVDALVLSRVAYMPFDGIVPRAFDKSISMADAARTFLNTSASQRALMPDDLRLAAALTESVRFMDMRLTGFVNQFEPSEQKQFCALCADLENGVRCVSFRGTDSTLVGWKEDFNMSFQETVPSQRVAVDYLREAAGRTGGRLMACGHSKGGNLAVFAASFCGENVQDRIDAVYNNDGPGLYESIVDSSEYARVSDKIHTFVPQTSIIGMLLERKERFSVVHSIAGGLLQHNVYTWELLRNQFVKMEGLTRSSRFIDSTIKDWVASRTPEERGEFINCVFELTETTDANTLKELTGKRFRNAVQILRSYRALDEQTKKMMMSTLSILVRCARDNASIVRLQGAVKAMAKKARQKELPAQGQTDDGNR